MNRRSFLITASSLTLMQLLAGCHRTSNALVQVRLLENSVPLQILREFQRRVESAQNINVLASGQLAELFDLLQTWQQADPETNGSAQPQPAADLITLGDFWLAAAIQQGLIQPLSLDEIPGWEALAEQELWQTLVRRDRQGQPSDTGELWAAPYRWGTLMIAYRRDRFEEHGIPAPTDWRDLWQPALERRISLPDHPRAVIGLTLKQLGESANTADLSTVANLSSDLEALHRQTRFYSSDAYLQPLILGDTWATVGWSTEILPLAERNPKIVAVAPASGTILTADLWVRPAVEPAVQSVQETTPAGIPDRSNLLNEWIGFFWQPPIANQLSLLSFAASPVLVGTDRTQLPAALTNTPLLPSDEILEASEFLLPLDESATAQYQAEWVRVRRSGSD
ncbi:extracellular solute-binding protein [Egbenema bharatensis]|uniref:extracellular solute-binding protein n=1 Tax=Egbenema bharatensis TaxID=3463334 RepID=UPI003A888B2A